MLGQHSRLRDPLVASTIFAPTPWNYMSSSVTVGESFAEAVAVDWILEQDAITVERLLTSQWRDMEEVQRFIAAFCEQLERSPFSALAIRAPAALTPAAVVPPRSFPFGGHLDILELPVSDGFHFDADDFVEH